MGEKDGRERQSNNGENHRQTYAIAAVRIRHSHSIVQRFKGLYQSRGGHDGDQAMVQRSRAQIGIRHGWSARKVQVAEATVATWPGVDGRSAVAVVVRNRPVSRNAVDIGRPHCHIRRKPIDSQVRRVCAELVPETADRRRWRLAPLALWTVLASTETPRDAEQRGPFTLALTSECITASRSGGGRRRRSRGRSDPRGNVSPRRPGGRADGARGPGRL